MSPRLQRAWLFLKHGPGVIVFMFSDDEDDDVEHPEMLGLSARLARATTGIDLGEIPTRDR